jgi:hypothetical protein
MTHPAVRPLILAAALVLPDAAAFASDDPPPVDLFERALAAAHQNHARASEVCAFEYEPSWSETGAFRFADEAGTLRWYDNSAQLLDAPPGNAPEDGRSLIGFPPDRVLETREPPRFLRWEDGLAVYRLRPSNVPLSGGGFDFEIADNVEAEVGIDPESAAVVYREVKAPSSFRPNAVVRIRGYETRVDLSPAWPGGPVVIARTRYDIAASAMLQSYDFNGSTSYSGFARCGG